MSTSSYTYGDSSAAAERLELLDEVYSKVTVPLLTQYAPKEPALAVDLGCGPGHTTRGLIDTLAPTRTLGVDASSAFVAAARVNVPDAEFIEGDLQSPELPWVQANVLFCRFLLGHLADPGGVHQRWLDSLAPGGVVLVQEYEWIQEDVVPPVARYLRLSEGMVRSGGAELKIGPFLASYGASLAGRTDVEVLCNREKPFKTDVSKMLRIFLLNLPALRAGNAAPDAELQQLETELTWYATAAGSMTACVREFVVARKP